MKDDCNMKHERSLGDILKIEDSADVLSVRCPDTFIPLWATIRTSFLRLIVGDMLYNQPIVGKVGSTSSYPKLRAATRILQSFAHNALLDRATVPGYPVVIMATGTRIIERGGLYFNPLSDYFIAAAPERTLAIEEMFDWKWPFPRLHKNLLLHTPWRVEGVLRGRLRVDAFRQSARALTDLVGRRAKDLLGWDLGEAQREWLETSCAISAASLLPRYRRYQSEFKKTRARLLIKEDACYGGADSASAILAARHLGMVTAEYQHGMVSTGHDGYNFAPTVLNNDTYKQIFPDYFLTFGSWWGEQINISVEKLAIGNPHRSEMLASRHSDFSQNRQILVLGEGIETTLYLEFCEQISIALGSSYEVVFRPHPFQRQSLAIMYPDGFFGRVRFDTQQDIYESFRKSAVVVAEASTGLFEAIGLVPKIFIWDTAKSRFSYPKHPFHRFSDAEELVHLIHTNSAGRVSAQQMESIWASNWKQNYLAFIEPMIKQ